MSIPDQEVSTAILLEGCRILRETVHCPGLPCHALHQHSDRHSTRERVRVDNHVRLHSAFRKWHIHRRPLLRTDTLLTVSRRELVAYNRRTSDTKRDVDFLQFRVASIAPWRRTISLAVISSGDKRTNLIASRCQRMPPHLPYI